MIDEGIYMDIILVDFYSGKKHSPVIVQILQIAKLQFPPQVGDFAEKHVSLRRHLLQLSPQPNDLIGEIHRRHIDDYRYPLSTQHITTHDTR